jgi:hypothetical protein
MARIRAGLERHAAIRPTTRPIDYRTVAANPRSTTDAGLLGLVVPVEGRNGKEARPIHDPLRTLTTRGETGLIVMLRGHNAAKTTTDPLDTFAASGFHHALIMRNNEDGAEMTTPVTEPLRTLTTAQHQSLLVYDFNGPARPISQPLPAQTTVEGSALLTPRVDIEDCQFRMLEPDEIKRGMAFPNQYVLLGKPPRTSPHGRQRRNPTRRPRPHRRRRRSPQPGRLARTANWWSHRGCDTAGGVEKPGPEQQEATRTSTPSESEPPSSQGSTRRLRDRPLSRLRDCLPRPIPRTRPTSRRLKSCDLTYRTVARAK